VSVRDSKGRGVVAGYCHWVTPASKSHEYVPDADTVSRIVSRLAETGWIKLAANSPYDPILPFYYAPFPGCGSARHAKDADTTDSGQAPSDGMILRSHCRQVTILVTDTLLVTPTVEARISCSHCGGSLLPAGPPDISKRMPDDCASCGAIVGRSDLDALPLFRFALVVEPFYSPGPGPLAIDASLLEFLRAETGQSFRESRQYL